MKGFTKFLLIPALVFTAAACDDDSTPFGVDSDFNEDLAREESSSFAPAPMTIADVVVDQANNQDEFIELLNAVLAADPAVLETLSGPGSFTVFAPTDAAFEALAATGALEGISQETLTQVLLFHVSRGAQDASEVLATSFVSMLDGNIARIDAGMGQIEGANIVATDIEASNGIIHVIDAVILPPM